MSTTMMRLPSVMARTGLSKAEVYRRIKMGAFPAQKRISHKCAVWFSDDIDAWIEKIRGGDSVATPQDHQRPKQR